MRSGKSMDFFDRQDVARRRTTWLLALYGCAIVLIVIAVYAAVTVGFFTYEYLMAPDGALPPFQTPWFTARRFAWSVGLTLGLVFVAAVLKYVQLLQGGGAVCRFVGGREVDATTHQELERRLINVVEEMAIASGAPIPSVYVLDAENGINAFAAGLTLNDAAIAVTLGALEQLDRDELQAVVAHEFSHILNGDMRLNIRLVAALHGILVLTIFARGLRRLFLDGRKQTSSWSSSSSSSSSSSDSRDDKGKGAGALVAAVVLVIVLVTIIGAIGSFFAKLIQAAVSRERELLSDASAVQFTRNAEAVANALRRIGGWPGGSWLDAGGAAALAHCFFANGLRELQSGLTSWSATHPPLEKRIRAVARDWDGEMLMPRKTIRERRAEEDRDEAERGRQKTLIGLVGQLSSADLAYAHDVVDTLQRELGSSLSDAAECEALLYLLLLHPEEGVREKQWQTLDVPVPVRTAMQRLAEVLARADRRQRLPLLELLLVPLKAAPRREVERIQVNVENMILTDDHVALFEFVVRRILRDRLRPKAERVHDPARGPRPKSQEVRSAAGAIVSAIVATSVDSEGVQPALAAASRAAGYEPPLEAHAFERGFDGLDAAIDVARRATYAEHRRILLACERAICADGQLALSEAELFRAIARALDCPIALGDAQSSATTAGGELGPLGSRS